MGGLSCGGGHIDDAPAPPLQHVGRHAFAGAEYAGQIDPEHPVPLLQGQVLEAAAAVDAGVVHQGVNFAVSLQARFRQSLRCGAVSNVPRHKFAPNA